MRTDVRWPFLHPRTGEKTVEANVPQATPLRMHVSTLRMVSPSLAPVLRWMWTRGLCSPVWIQLGHDVPFCSHPAVLQDFSQGFPPLPSGRKTSPLQSGGISPLLADTRPQNHGWWPLLSFFLQDLARPHSVNFASFGGPSFSPCFSVTSA